MVFLHNFNHLKWKWNRISWPKNETKCRCLESPPEMKHSSSRQLYCQSHGRRATQHQDHHPQVAPGCPEHRGWVGTRTKLFPVYREPLGRYKVMGEDGVYGGLVMCPRMTAWQLLFPRYLLEKCVDPMQIRCTERNLTVFSSGNGAKATQKSPPKPYVPNLDFKTKGDSWGGTFNEGIVQLVMPTHCKHCLRSVMFTKEVLNLQLELDVCPEL